MVLNGAVKQIQQDFKEDIFEVTFKGSKIAFTNAMWTGAELLDSKESDGITTSTVRLLNNLKPNDLLKAILPEVEILGLREIVPTMSEIFIKKVQEKTGGNHE